MIKSDRYGTGFLVEEDRLGAGTGIHDIDQPIPSSWKTIEDISLFSLYRRPGFEKFNTLTQLVIEALDTIGMNPEIFIQGRPRSASSYVKPIQNPSTLALLARDTGKAAAEGQPPIGFKLLVSGPRIEEVETLIDSAYTLWNQSWPKFQAKNKDTEGPSYRVQRDEYVNHLQKLVTAIARQKVRTKNIVAWVELGLQTKQGAKAVRDARAGKSGEAPTSFEFQQHGYAVTGYAGGYASHPISQSVKNKWSVTDAYVQKHPADVREAILQVIYHDTWASFKHWLRVDRDGFVQSMEAVLDSTPVRLGYDAAHGRKTATRFSKPRERPLVRNPKGLRPSKVVGSVADTGSTIGTMVVTANELERVRQDAQGNWIKPPPMPKQMGAQIPESSVKRWLSSDKYEAIFGIYLDHPLVVPVKNKQIYWYSERNMFFKAILQYSTMTGASPALAYRIFRKTGDRAGISITKSELKKDLSSDGFRFLNGLNGLNSVISAFNNHVRDGKKLYRASLTSWIGDVDIPQNAYADMPKAPEGLDHELFAKYVNWVRREATTTMGLSFRRNMPTSMIDPETGRVRRFPNSRHQIPVIKQMLHQSKFTGERDGKGRVAEKSGVYLIEYLLAHKRDTYTPETYMIPLNVIRADEDVDPLRTPTRMNKATLTQIMYRSFPSLRLVRDTSAWTFILPGKSQDLPYARLIRPSTVLGSEIPDINKRLPSHFKRTHHGYKISGVEWWAYQMFVVLPPSVAEKQLGLIHRNAYRKLIIDDPGAVDRLRRGTQKSRRKLKDFGVTPMELHTSFIEDPDTLVSQPLAKASQRGTKIIDVTGTSSELDLDWAVGDIGDKWKPKFTQVSHEILGYIERHMTGYTSAKTVEDKIEILKEYKEGMDRFSKEIGHDMQQYMMLLSQRSMAKRSKYGKDLSRAVQTYIKYVREEISGTGHHITIPQVVKDLGLGVYEAPFAAVYGRTLEYSVKAVSESVARYLILLRLLRRSVTNKNLGKAMDIRSKMGQRRIFPDHNARVLAQWAKTGWTVIEQNDPKGSYFKGPKRHLEKDELRRGEVHAQHRYANWVRTD